MGTGIGKCRKIADHIPSSHRKKRKRHTERDRKRMSKKEEREATNRQSPPHNDVLPLKRLCLLKVTQLSETVSPPTGDQVYDFGNWTTTLKLEAQF